MKYHSSILKTIVYVNLPDFLSQSLLEKFSSADHSDFTFGDCSYSLIQPSLILPWLQEQDASPEVDSAMEFIDRLPREVYINLEN